MNILNKCALFRNMNKEQTKKFIADTNSFYQDYDKGQHIINVGDEVLHISIIVSGELIIYKLDNNGNKNIVNNLTFPNFFGPALALYNKSAVSNVEVTKKCKILHIPKHNLDTNTIETNIFYKNLVQAISNKNIELNHKVHILGIKNLQDRILEFLKFYQTSNNTKFKVPYNKQQLADYLLVDRSTLSRELSKLKELGILDYNKNEFIIY